MKKLENLGKSLTRDEQKRVLGGRAEEGGTCSTICYNCVALSMYCSTTCTPNSHGIWCNGTFHACPQGDYCN